MTTKQMCEDDPKCESFLPGHRLHWSLYKRASSARAVLVSEVRATDAFLELTIPDEPPLRWRHHDPERLVAAVADSTTPILAYPEWRALRVDGYWFNCAPQDTDLSICGSKTAV